MIIYILLHIGMSLLITILNLQFTWNAFSFLNYFPSLNSTTYLTYFDYRWRQLRKERLRCLHPHWWLVICSWVWYKSINAWNLISYFSNNAIEVNLLECTEKEEFSFDKLDTAPRTETETAAGRIAATLQDKTVKLLQRRRWRIILMLFAQTFLSSMVQSFAFTNESKHHS